MAILNDGNFKVSVVMTIADMQEPSPTELNAGDDITCFLTADDPTPGFSPDTAQVDVSAACDIFDVTLPGRQSFSGAGLNLLKQGVEDEIFDLLVDGLEFYLVIRRDVPTATAYANLQPVEVYKVRASERQEGQVGKNTPHRYMVPLGMIASPKMRAVVTT